MANEKESFGECKPKIGGQMPSTIQNSVYITTKDLGANNSGGNGTINNPYDNLLDGIERAYELAAPYNIANITIYLFTGDHFLVRGERSFYVPLSINKESQNLNLKI